MAKTTRKKFIAIRADKIRVMMDVYGVTRQTVYNALGFRTDSEIAEKIRKDAIECYGGVVSHKLVFTN